MLLPQSERNYLSWGGEDSNLRRMDITALRLHEMLQISEWRAGDILAPHAGSDVRCA